MAGQSLEDLFFPAGREDKGRWVPEIGPDGKPVLRPNGQPMYRPPVMPPSDNRDLAIRGDPMEDGGDGSDPGKLAGYITSSVSPEARVRFTRNLANAPRSENVVDATSLGRLLPPVLKAEEAASRVRDWGPILNDIGSLRPYWTIKRVDPELPRRDASGPATPQNTIGSIQDLLVPGIARNGRILKNEIEAEEEFRKTGDHYGSYSYEDSGPAGDKIRQALELALRNYMTELAAPPPAPRQRTGNAGSDAQRNLLMNHLGAGYDPRRH